MRAPQLIAFDIDGTLIAPGAHLDALPDAEMSELVARLVRAGIEVVLASGRMYPGTERVARHLGLDGPRICQQGACVHRPDGSVLHGFSIDGAIANELVDYAHAHDWPFAWFDSQRYLVSRQNPQSDVYARVSGVVPEYREDAHRVGVIPTGIDIISSEADASDVHRELQSRYGDRVHLLDFPSVTAAHSPEASKGNALAMVAQDLGIDRSSVLAIGDSVNDASMLRWAGIGLALPHSDRYARAAADDVLGGTGLEGLVAFLREILRSAE